MDDAQKEKAKGMTCTCEAGKSAGKTYGECCGKNLCACGSNKAEMDCCATNAPKEAGM